MNVKLFANPLLNAFTFVNQALHKNKILPILDNAACLIKGDTLFIKVTDLNTTLVTSLHLEEATEPGTFLIPAVDVARLLGTLARKVDDVPVTLEIDTENYLHVVSWSTGSQKLTGAAPNLYPTKQSIKGEVILLTLDEEERRAFCRALHNSVFACSSNEFKPSLCGVNIRGTESNLHIVASDGAVIAAHKVKLSYCMPFNITITRPFASMIYRTFESTAGSLELKIGERAMLVSAGEFTLMSQLVTEPFPAIAFMFDAYRQRHEFLTMDKNTLSRTIGRALLTAPDETRSVVLTAPAESRCLYISSDNPDYEKETETWIELPELTGSAIHVRVNGSLLKKAITNTVGDELRFTFGNHSEIITVEGEALGSVCFIAPQML